MVQPLSRNQEGQRVQALYNYLILDTLPEKDFDGITRLAAHLCNAPVAFINFIDEDRQWCKAAIGIEDIDPSLANSFCVHAANTPDEIMEVPDTRKSNLFANNPFVTGKSPIISYAGVPLVNSDGFFLGTLCVSSHQPKHLSAEQKASLKSLADLTVRLLETRKDKFKAEENNLLYQQAVKLFEDTSEVAKVGGWSVDLISNQISWTDVTKKIHEVPLDYAPGIKKGILFYKAGKSRELMQSVVNEAFTNGTPYDVELELVTAKGNCKWVRTIGQVEMKNGKAVRFYGIIQDIHTEKIKDIQLAQSEQQFRETFNHATIGMAIVSLSGQWLKVNKSICDLVGYTEKELLQTTFQQITYPDDIDEDLKNVHELLSGNISSYRMEKRYIHKKGSVVWVILSASLVKDMDNQPLHFVSQIMDITLRKQYEDKLKEERRLLTTVIDNLPANIFIKDRQLKKVLVNDREVEYLGAESKASVLGKTDFDFYPDETARISLAEDKEVLEKGISILHKETYNIKSDNSMHWFLTSKIPLKNNNGDVTALLGICHDITERKNIELVTYALMDVTKEQNNRLINFAHIVSHNLKAHAINFSMLLKLINEEESEDEKRSMFSMLTKASDNLIKTIDHLNEVVVLTTRTDENAKPVNLYQATELIKTSVHTQLLESGVKLYNNIGKDVEVNVFPAYLESILLNFITNGIKYKAQREESFIKLSATLLPSYVVLNITDNGLGIDLSKNKEKLFGMYKTFHNNKDARGIGLFITKNQVLAMGGKIEVESKPGEGTIFKVFFLRK